MGDEAIRDGIGFDGAGENLPGTQRPYWLPFASKLWQQIDSFADDVLKFG
jgi:hypothetical protein